MSDSLQQASQSDPLTAIATLALVFVVYLVLGFLPVCGATYLIYFLLTLPMRRNERARMFLDLLELGLKEGRTPEAAITGAAASRDRSLGVRFHLLAAYLEQGMRLSSGARTGAPAAATADPRHAQDRRTHRRPAKGAARLPPMLLRDSVSQSAAR